MGAKYYAMIDGERKGPFELEELPGIGVRPSTYIWTKGLPDWQKAEENADVCRLFRNHLYDVMHPGVSVDSQTIGPEDAKWKVEPDPKDGGAASRFDSYLREEGSHLPTLDEIEASKDTAIPPVSMVSYAWLVTIFCCWPTGIVALVFAYKSKKAWKQGDNTLSHEYCRRAKMWTGISFFLGLIGWAAFFALSL